MSRRDYHIAWTRFWGADQDALAEKQDFLFGSSGIRVGEFPGLIACSPLFFRDKRTFLGA
jgi:hypothetical protein